MGGPRGPRDIHVLPKAQSLDIGETSHGKIYAWQVDSRDCKNKNEFEQIHKQY